MFTSTSTGPDGCGGATTTSSDAVLSIVEATVPPNFTYVEQTNPGQASGRPMKPAPWMCTISPPRVRPPAGEIVDTVTSEASDAAANERAAAKEGIVTLQLRNV